MKTNIRVCQVTQVSFQFLLFTLSHGNPFWHARQQQQRYSPAIPPLPWHVAPPWEYILHEIILKSVAPSPPDASTPHKRPLDASFYGGPTVAHSTDDVNVVLSRGNVYHLLNGHWILCQDGCVDCEPCATLRNPLFKWILRRVKRLPASDPPRHDLQLTIIPQTDDRIHATNLWLNSDVYVTTQEEGKPFAINREQYDGERDSLRSLENSFSEQHHRSKNLWRLTERDLITDEIPQRGDRATTKKNANTTEKISKVEPPRHKFRNTRRRFQLISEEPVTDISTMPNDNVTASENGGKETNLLMPKLILGTDRQGQKHLVHLVPADHPPTTPLPINSFASNRPITSQLAADQPTHLNGTVPQREGQTYHRIFRRVLDSLNTHKRSIENFLESGNVENRGMMLPTNNTEIVGFPGGDRDTNRTNANFEHLPFYEGDDDRMEKYQRYRSGYSYENTKQDVGNYHLGYGSTSTSNVLRSKESVDLDWEKGRRRTHVKPLSTDSTRQDISRINSSSRSYNSSLGATPKLGSSDFIINSVRQIELNDTSVDKVFVSANNSVEPIPVTTYRGNGQLFNPKRLESGDVNRKFKALHHPFRIIVTTKSPVIRKEHETSNRTKALQLTT